MITLKTTFLSLVSISVVTASVFQRQGGASTDPTPESFVADSFDYIIVGKDSAMLCTTSWSNILY
jgi:hypothetical protein